jgi:hypothetical protein
MELRDRNKIHQPVPTPPPDKKPYVTPSLTRFGDVRTLTSAASDPNTMEGNTSDPDCADTGDNRYKGPCRA